MQPSAGGSDPVPPSLKRLRMSDTAESAGALCGALPGSPTWRALICAPQPGLQCCCGAGGAPWRGCRAAKRARPPRCTLGARADQSRRPAGGSGGEAGTIAAPALLPAPVDSEAREEVFQNEDLMKQVFQQLCLEDLCKAGMVRRRWREITNNPAFWRLIDLEGKPLTVSKVRAGWTGPEKPSQ